MKLAPDAAEHAVKDYCNSGSRHPYFMCVDGTDEYKQILNAIPDSYKKLRVSSYCGKDTLPDYDQLIDDIIKDTDNIFIVGLGESCFLTDQMRILARLKDLSLSHKVVIIARNCEAFMNQLAVNDQKFTSYRWCAVLSDTDYSVVRIASEMKFDALNGFKSLLYDLEKGTSGKIYVRTGIALANSAVIRDAYDALKVKYSGFTIPRSRLTDDMWTQYLANPSLDTQSIKTWRYYLKLLLEGTESPYFRLVLSNSSDYEEYKKKLLTAILKVRWDSPMFEELFEERKEILSQFEEYEIEEYVEASKERNTERIHYLTDKTILEKRAIIEEISRLHSLPDNIKDIYPSLGDYLHDFHFTCANGDKLTDYFREYKREKLLNQLTDGFRQIVDEYSIPTQRLYTSLRTRKQVLTAEKAEISNPGLYWLDALGVEYLGFIQTLAKNLGMTLKVSVAKSLLPTLTVYNKSFYDEWQGPRADADKNLDDIKHHGNGAVIKSAIENDGSKYLPTYLADELDVIEGVVNKIHQMLYQHQTSVVFLVSDHGASRLAVINNHENKWKMASNGEHSGRCCPLNEIDEQPLSATREDRDIPYWVLANYDRFKGGRKADIEVHGGATLEEVVIPIIRFELTNSAVDCHLISNYEDHENVIIESLDGNPVLHLYCSIPNAKLTLSIKGKAYAATVDSTNSTIYSVKLDGMWRNGSYVAEVYHEDNSICHITFTIKKENKGCLKKRDGSEFFL